MQSKIVNIKKAVVARLDAGDDLMLALKEVAQKNGIKSAFFTLIGGLKKISYGLYEDGSYRHIVLEAKHCFEVLPTAGNVTLKDGELFVHSHLTAADEKNGTAFGGHLMEGSIVYPFAEVFMQEIDVELVRQHDPKTNLFPIEFKSLKV